MQPVQKLMFSTFINYDIYFMLTVYQFLSLCEMINGNKKS